jgi:hypothetical protein
MREFRMFLVAVIAMLTWIQPTHAACGFPSGANGQTKYCGYLASGCDQDLCQYNRCGCFVAGQENECNFCIYSSYFCYGLFDCCNGDPYSCG